MKSTDKHQRLLAAINGEPVDRVPIALWRHWPVDDQYASNLARVTIGYQNEFDWDFVKVTPELNYCLADWGAATRWNGTHLDGARDWAGQTEGDHGGPRDWGERVPVIQTIFTPLCQAHAGD